MTAAAKIPTKPTSAKDAVALLKADHQAVNALFAEFEKVRSVPKKKALVEEICTELTVHAQLEEELFYPQVQEAMKDEEMVPEAMVEHAGMKRLIAELEEMEPDAALYDAKVKVLSEYVKHHVKEEQTQMFPAARASSLDLVALGEQLVARKAELMAELGER